MASRSLELLHCDQRSLGAGAHCRQGGGLKAQGFEGIDQPLVCGLLFPH